MFHSITFGEKNTWDDWHLVPSSRPVFSSPSKKTASVDIPGGNGAVDLSESVSGAPIFQNRTGSIEFTVQNGFMEWQKLYSELMSYLHGKKMRAVLEDDPNYYYEGRFAVDSWSSDEHYSTVTISYTVSPRRYHMPLTEESYAEEIQKGNTQYALYVILDENSDPISLNDGSLIEIGREALL